jgi:hypothetical protein
MIVAGTAMRPASIALLLALAAYWPAPAAAQNAGQEDLIARDADKLRRYILGLRGFQWNENRRDLEFVGEGDLRRLLQIQFKPMGVHVAFTPQVNNRGSGNPDLDRIALPQFSLNYDPLLGRYWWE